MPGKMIIYHGSPKIIERPKFGVGKAYNDFGQGFYCTENMELAKEWACTVAGGGFANQYQLDLTGLNMLSFSGPQMHVLNWLAVLVQNRRVRVSGWMALAARNYLMREFLPDLSECDILKGCRGDDSCFSFAVEFLNGGLSLEQITALTRGARAGEEVVLKSERAFGRLTFTGYDQAEQSVYYAKRELRDTRLRASVKPDEGRSVYLVDILREGWKNDDPRLRRNLSK